MKIRLWCRLFGHKFIAADYKTPIEYSLVRVDYCVNCGLTKDDIIKLEHLKKRDYN